MKFVIGGIVQKSQILSTVSKGNDKQFRPLADQTQNLAIDTIYIYIHSQQKSSLESRVGSAEAWLITHDLTSSKEAEVGVKSSSVCALRLHSQSQKPHAVHGSLQHGECHLQLPGQHGPSVLSVTRSGERKGQWFSWLATDRLRFPEANSFLWPEICF